MLKQSNLWGICVSIFLIIIGYVTVSFISGFAGAIMAHIVTNKNVDIWEILGFVTALVSSIVAIGALFFSIYQGRKNRQYNERMLNQTIKHNKISVTPIVVIDASLDTENTTLSIKCKNTGIGPAIIKECKVFYDEELVSDKLRKKIQNFYKQKGIDVSFREIRTSEFSIAVNEEKYLFECKDTVPPYMYTDANDANNIRSQFKDIPNKISIKIKYTSMYQDKLITVSHPSNK